MQYGFCKVLDRQFLVVVYAKVRGPEMNGRSNLGLDLRQSNMNVSSLNTVTGRRRLYGERPRSRVPKVFCVMVCDEVEGALKEVTLHSETGLDGAHRLQQFAELADSQTICRRKDLKRVRCKDSNLGQYSDVAFCGSCNFVELLSPVLINCVSPATFTSMAADFPCESGARSPKRRELDGLIEQWCRTYLARQILVLAAALFAREKLDRLSAAFPADCGNAFLSGERTLGVEVVRGEAAHMVPFAD